MSHPQVPLGEIADLIRGITYKPTDVCDANAASAVACMRTKNVQEALDESDIVWIPDSLIRNPAKYLRPGDILVSSANSWNLVGKGCWVPELKYPASAGGFISILRGNPDAVDLRYLYHWIISPQTQAKLRSYSNKTTNISNLDHGRTLATEIPLPPLDEQRRIAAILDKSHSIQSLYIQRHQMMQALINSMLISDFGSPSEWPLRWEMQKLGDCCECLDKHRRPVKESDRQEGDVPYYGANGQQGWIDDFLFDESLVLVAEDGGHFADRMRGVAYRIDGKAWVNNHAHILRPRGNALEIEFLHRILRHYDFMPYISGSTRSKLTQGQLNDVLIPVPPIDRQRNFSCFVEKLVASLDTSSRSLEGGVMLSRSLAKSLLESEA